MKRNRNYYYSHTLSNQEQDICDLIIDGLEKKKNSIILSGIASSNASIIKVMEIINLDFPEFFYFNVSATRIWKFGTKVKIDLGYYYSINEIEIYERKISQRVSKILNKIPSEISLSQKEKIIHDDLVRNIQYAKGDLTNPKLHNIVGAIVDGVAVCEGYAKSFKYICDKLDLLCMVVTGTAISKVDGVNGPHAWNIVRVSGKGCCHVDVTWDSCFYHCGSSCYVFFNQTDEEMANDHSWDRSKTPKCEVVITSEIPFCETARQLEDVICKNIKLNILSFSVKVKKEFSGNDEVLAFTKKILGKHLDLMVKRYTVSYISARKQIEYEFEKF